MPSTKVLWPVYLYRIGGGGGREGGREIYKRRFSNKKGEKGLSSTLCARKGTRSYSFSIKQDCQRQPAPPPRARTSKSQKLFHLLKPRPAECQALPRSPPPRTCAKASTHPLSSIHACPGW